MNLRKLADMIVANGGASYNLNTGELNPTEGYMVATEGHEQTVEYVDEDILRDYIDQHVLALAEENHFLGAWLSNGKYVLDVSEIMAQKRQAIFFGIIRKQDEVWDCAKGIGIKILDK
jgi:hypothetical protein